MSKNKNKAPAPEASYQPLDAHIRRTAEAHTEQRRREAARQETIDRIARDQIARAQRQSQIPTQTPYPVGYGPRVSVDPTSTGYRPQVGTPTRRTQPENPNTHVKSPEKRTRRRSLHLGKGALVGIVTTAAIVVGGGVAYTNRDEIGTMIADWQNEANKSQTQDRTLNIEDNNSKLDGASFAPDVCMKPEATLMVATLKEVDYPLVPMVTATGQTAPSPVAKIFIDPTPEGILGDSKSLYENDAKSSINGYPAATLENFPVAINVCMDEGALNQSSKSATVDMSKTNIVFSDANQIFNRTDLVQASVSHGGGTEDITLDPSKGQYLKYSDPAYWLQSSSDQGVKDSGAEITKTIFTPEQMQMLLTTIELSAYNQLADPTYSGDDISYPDGAATLRDAVQNAIAKRLKLDRSKISFSDTIFKHKPEVMIDQATKQPIVTVDPTTGKSNLVGIDGTQNAVIKSVEYVNGALTPPSTAQAPPETPTPAASTTPEPAKQP